MPDKMGKEDFESVACNLCGSVEYRVKFQPWVDEYDPQKVLSASGGIRGTQQIVICKQCGLEFVNPRLKSGLVVAAYSSAEDELYTQAGAGRLATFQRSLKLIERYSSPPGRLLDVGCASGFFVQAAGQAGWQAEGVEPSRWFANYGREKLGVTIFPGTLREAKFPDAAFKVITVWDVLEHVPDPLAELREIYRILEPGGVLLVNYPNAGSLLARLAGRNWWFYLSVHLYYFTPRTIAGMLNRAGFEVKAHRRHIQVLPLGHLIKVASIYLGKIAELMFRVTRALHLSELKLPYYASQANIIAVKSSEQVTP
jgi:2-polyprenyl-3-methyl-5-hydroxy-6-metoxy-1,4-benzoquinol methylase